MEKQTKGCTNGDFKLARLLQGLMLCRETLICSQACPRADNDNGLVWKCSHVCLLLIVNVWLKTQGSNLAISRRDGSEAQQCPRSFMQTLEICASRVGSVRFKSLHQPNEGQLYLKGKYQVPVASSRLLSPSLMAHKYLCRVIHLPQTSPGWDLVCRCQCLWINWPGVSNLSSPRAEYTF